MGVLYNMFSSITLRRTKEMVREQLGLPEHSVITKPLHFSTFERALYEEKLTQYRQVLLTNTTHTLHPTNATTTLHIDIFDAKAKLELLRKGCCHPQVLDRTLATRTRTTNTNNTTNTNSNNTSTNNTVTAGPRPLDEIMVIKVEQTRVLCEEHQRGLLFHLYALAATCALQAQCGVMRVGEYGGWDGGTSGDNSSGCGDEGGSGRDSGDDEMLIVDENAFVQSAYSTRALLNAHNNTTKNTNSTNSNNTTTLTPIHYLLHSFLAYTLALRIVHRNRQPTTLIAMCRVSGEGLAINDYSVSVRKFVPHAHDGMSVSWDVSNVFSRASNGSIASGDRSCSGSSKISADTNVSQIEWTESYRNGRLQLSHPTSTSSTSSTISLGGITTAHTANIALTAQLMFASGRRITAMNVKCDLYALHKKFYIQQHHMHNSRKYTHTTSSRDQNGSDSSTYDVYEVVLIPSTVDLQVGVGTADVYTNVLSVQVPSVNTSGGSSGDSGSNSAGGDASTTQRSKRYQLYIPTIHSKCMVQHARHTSTGVHVTHSFIDVSSIPSLYNAVHSSGTGGNSGDSGSGGVSSISIKVCAQVKLQEGAFDIDALQELHVCHNIGTLESILPESLKPRFAQCVERVLGSQDPLHNNGDGSRSGSGSSGSGGGTSMVGLEVKSLQPGTVVCSEGDGSSGSGSSSVGSSSVDSTSLTTQFLKSVAVREKQIETEFLEAASGRRLLSVAHLSEQSNLILDMEGDIHSLLQGGVVEAKSSGGAEKHHTTTPTRIPAAQRTWWNQLLFLVQDDLHFQASLQSCIDQGEAAYRKLANCHTMHGLQYVLGKEYDAMMSARAKALKVLSGLSAQPTPQEITESSDCHQCRQYFNKTGPACAHCRKQALLHEYSSYIVCYRRQNKRVVASSATAHSPAKKAKHAKSNNNKNNMHLHILDDRSGEFETGLDSSDTFEVRKFDEGVVDGVVLMVLKQLKVYAGRYEYVASGTSGGSGSGGDSVDGHTNTQSFKDLCALEIKLQQHLNTELTAMTAVWDRYSDLLKAHDELSQCRMRTGLDTSTISSGKNSAKNSNSNGGSSSVHGRNSNNKNNTNTQDKQHTSTDAALLHPYELHTTAHTAYSSALQSEYELRKSSGSLAFYKDQVKEIFEVVDEEVPAGGSGSSSGGGSGSGGGAGSARTSPTNTRNATAKTNTTHLPTDRERALLTSPVKVVVPTCLICREDLNTVTAHTPSKHHHAHTTGTAHPLNTTSVEEEEVVLLPCAHRFHRDCVTRWVRKHKNCPLCKAACSVTQLVAVAQHIPLNYATEHVQVNPGMKGSVAAATNSSSAIDATSNTTSTFSNANTNHTTTTNNATTNNTTTVPTPPRRTGNTRLVGKWGTKVDCLVSDLLELVEHPDKLDEKCIVFSQWVEMIDIVALALQANRLPHVKCINRNKDFTSTGSLQLFRTNTAVRILLMPLALGAEGLDLIVASHVYLLEPLLNIHQELQAVNRISRLGQSKRTYVHKYVVQNTIEERIVTVQQRNTSSTTTSNANTSTAGNTPSKANKAAKRSTHKHSDDDLLSEADLVFILGLNDTVVLSDGMHTIEGSSSSGAGGAVSGGEILSGPGQGSTTTNDAEQVDGENDNSSVHSVDDDSNSDGGGDSDTGSFDLSTRLMDHLEE